MFNRNVSGNVAMMFALVAPLLIGAVGGGVDYARYFLTTQSLQEIADMAALAGARQYVIASDTPQIPQNVAKSVAESGVSQTEAAGATVTSSADTNESSVSVHITHSYQPTFLVALYKSPLTVAVESTAVASGSANVCVIALNPSSKGAMKLTGSAHMTGPSCALFSNSTNKTGLTAWESTKITSALTCSAGGYGGGDSNFDPAPTTDCPARDDPLSTRTPPTIGSCDYNNFQLEDYDGSINPGVYCGGLTVLGASDVTFNAGVYIIKDGNMKIHDTSRITGTDVGFYFEGNGSSLFFEDNSEIELSAPIAGSMAGILIWQEPTGNTVKTFQVASNNVHTLVGTIYLPMGRFLAYANAPVAQSSAYTAIIANEVELFGNVDLVLNTDYNATPVPVPAGMTGAGGSVHLRD